MQRSVTTIRQVARAAGVSPATVSRVLNGSAPVSEATRERVLQVVDDLGFEPNAVARSLATRASNIIATIISDIRNPFYAELVAGIQETAEALGYLNYLCHAHQNVERERAFLSSLRARRVDGIIVGHSRLTDEDLWSHWERIDVPVVLINRTSPPSGTGTWSHVSTDDREGGYLATSHLLALGHRRIAHLAGTHNSSIAQNRVQGYRQALAEHGVCYDARLVVVTDPPTLEAGRANMFTLLDQLDEPATAVFAFSDIMAIGALEAIHARGLRVPEDISIVGHDDIPAALWVEPALTTVRMPVYEMGKLAMDKLCCLLQGRCAVEGQMVELNLVVRASTGRPPASPA